MSYPFEYLRSRNWRVETGFAYVLHPFKGIGDRIAEKIVRRAVQEEGLEYRSAKGPEGTAPILNAIMKGIAEADIVIGVMARCNANVFWEIGLAMSWKPATQVLTVGEEGKRLERVPFNIRGFRHVFIRPQDRDEAIKRVRSEIRQLRQRHTYIRNESIISAHNSLGPAELGLMFRLGIQGHFALAKRGETLVQIALGNLCRLGLVALSTKRKGRQTEFSFYWTPLGNLVLQRLGNITPEETRARLDELAKTRPEIRNWRGGHVFGPILSS